MWLSRELKPEIPVPQCSPDYKSLGLFVQWRKSPRIFSSVGCDEAGSLCPFPSPTRALGLVVLLESRAPPIPIFYPAHPTLQLTCIPPQAFPLHPASPIHCSLSSSCHSAKKEKPRAFFPNQRLNQPGPKGQIRNGTQRAAPCLSLERLPQGEGPEGGCRVRRLPSPGLGQGATEKASCIPSLSSAFLSIHPAPPPWVPIKGAASSQTTSVPHSLGPKPLPSSPAVHHLSYLLGIQGCLHSHRGSIFWSFLPPSLSPRHKLALPPGSTAPTGSPDPTPPGLPSWPHREKPEVPVHEASAQSGTVVPQPLLNI